MRETKTTSEAQDVKYDGQISWSQASGRDIAKVSLVKGSWSKFCSLFTEPERGHLTAAQYAALDKEQQLNEKDVGYFVGAEFKNDQRAKNNVLCRTMLTLDFDDAVPPDILQVLNQIGYSALIHTTRNSTPSALRCRVIFPFNRSCSVEEYLGIWNWIRGKFLEQLMDVDPTSKDPAHCMFWPSVHANGVYDVRVIDLPWLS